MSDSFKITLDTTKLKELEAKAPGRAQAVVLEELRKFVLFFLEDLREQRLSGTPLHVRTGALRRDGAVTSQIVAPGIVRADAVWSLPYAATQEFGDPNRTSPSGKYLAIPLPAAKTAAGVSRFPSPLRVSLQGAFDSTFVRRSKAGNLILFGTKGEELIPLFVLKKSVSIPARMGARELFAKQITELNLAATINARLAAALIAS